MAKKSKNSASNIVTKIGASAHKDAMEKILLSFDDFFKRAKNEHVCAMLPELDIAKYCLEIYNAIAKDKAIIVNVPKDSTGEWAGKVVSEVRKLTKVEIDSEEWEEGTTAIEFTDGTIVYPSRDDEGNGAGTMFMKDKKGKSFYVFAKE